VVRAARTDDAPSAPGPQLGRALERHPARSVLMALARAPDAEQAARIATERVDELRGAGGLPPALAQVMQQIQQAARSAPPITTLGPGRTAPAPSGGYRAPAASARLAPSKGSAPVVSMAMMRLTRRLQKLVHIAETDRRLLEAQRRVRMAEDSAHARADAASGPAATAAEDGRPVDLDQLGREVLSAVTSKYDSRTDRRLEDPDDQHDIFW